VPDLDVSDIILDPDFAETLTIKRRQANVGSNGRATQIVTTITPAPVGTVQTLDAGDLERGSDQQVLPKRIQVITSFRLRGASQDAQGNEFQPDLIIWQGDSYQVDSVEPWTAYGAGWVAAKCSSIDSLDQAPT
jgi:hypothetical protein